MLEKSFWELLPSNGQERVLTDIEDPGTKGNQSMTCDVEAFRKNVLMMSVVLWFLKCVRKYCPKKPKAATFVRQRSFDTKNPMNLKVHKNSANKNIQVLQ